MLKQKNTEKTLVLPYVVANMLLHYNEQHHTHASQEGMERLGIGALKKMAIESSALYEAESDSSPRRMTDYNA